MKQILCIFIFVFNIYLSLTVQAQNLTSKNLPKNLTVTLNYWQQINGFFAYNEKLPEDCNIKSTINSRVLICPAWVKILINKKQLLSWQQQQNKNGFINLYLPKIGVLHEKTKITKIKKIIQQVPPNKKLHLVTAVYMRYAHVLKYKIKDIDTDKIEEITTTPEHKFYETTYKKFVAISKLGPDNTITNASNHHLKIICTNNRQNNCSTAPLNTLQKVYNMEVEKAHNYFVGNIKMLVHNGCYDYYYRCRHCLETHVERDYFTKKCEKTVDKLHELKKFYQCEFCGMSTHDRNNLDRHKRIHNNRYGEYSCGLCSAIFFRPTSLRQHIDMHIRNSNLIFCGECDTFISLIDKLNGHYIHKNIIKSCFSQKRSRSPLGDFLYFINTVNGLDLDKEINYQES